MVNCGKVHIPGGTTSEFQAGDLLHFEFGDRTVVHVDSHGRVFTKPAMSIDYVGNKEFKRRMAEQATMGPSRAAAMQGLAHMPKFDSNQYIAESLNAQHAATLYGRPATDAELFDYAAAMREGRKAIDDDIYDLGVSQCPKCGLDIGRGGFCRHESAVARIFNFARKVIRI